MQLIEAVRGCSATAAAEAAVELGSLAVDAENRSTIAKADGIAVLLELARTGSDECRCNAASALANLTHNNSENKASIVRCSGIAVLIDVARTASAAAKEAAAGALRNLAADNTENGGTITEHGGIAVLIDLARSGSDKAKEYAAGIRCSAMNHEQP